MLRSKVSPVLVALAISCALIIAVASQAWAADERSRTAVVLKEAIELDFLPDEGFFLVEFESGDLQRIGAVLMPPFETANNEGGKSKFKLPGRFLAGARVLTPVAEGRLQYSLILVGKPERFAFVPPKDLELKHGYGENGLDSVDSLRERLLRRKQNLQSLELQIRTQEESLARLRADADVIGNLGRIVEIKEEIVRLDEENAGLDKDIQTLEKFLKLARSNRGPKNFALRESQLTKQLAELAEAAKAAESGELGRRSQSEQELQKKLELVEAARNEDYEALQRTLVRLRKRRLEIERLPVVRSDRPRFESPEDYVR